MYVLRDAVASSIKSHTESMRFKNTIKRHWPQNDYAGVRTFGNLELWSESNGVNTSVGNKKIYGMIGISIKDIEQADKKGLSSMYLSVTAMSNSVVVTDDDIRAYVNQFTPLIYPASKDPFNINATEDTDLNPDPYKDNPYPGDNPPLWDKDGWITSYLTYTPVSPKEVASYEAIGPVMSDDAIIAYCKGYSPEVISYDDALDNRLTAVALLDTNNDLYETTFTVKQRTVIDKHSRSNIAYSNRKYLKQAVVEMKFRRIISPYDVSVDALISSVRARIDVLNGDVTSIANWVGVGEDIKVTSMNIQLSINKQLIRMANYVLPAVDDTRNYVVSQGLADSYVSDNDVVEIKYDYLMGLAPREFTKEFGKAVKAGYSEKPVEWWQKVVVVVLVIIIIVIAVIITIVTLGAGATLATSLAYASIALVVGSLLLTGLSMYWGANGEPGAARFAAGGAEVVGYLAMATGIASSVATIAIGIGQAGLVAKVMVVGNIIALSGTIGGELGIFDEDAATILSVIGATLTIGASIAQSAGKVGSEVSKNVAKSGVTEVALDKVREVVAVNLTGGAVTFVKLSSTQLAVQLLSYTNTLFNAYVQLIDPGKAQSDDLVAELRAQEKEMETLSPEKSEAIWTSYTDPYGSIYEVGDVFDRSYGLLTQGKNRELMNKHYESGY